VADEQKKDEAQPQIPAGGAGEASKPAAAEEKKAAPPPKPAAPAKPAVGPEPLDNELVRRLRARFGSAIGDTTLDRKQAIVVVRDRLAEICEYLKGEEKFNFLADLTAVDWFDRQPRFEIIFNLYSFPHNQRLRVKATVGDTCPSVTRIWPAANWLERECYDMFGIRFEGHPNLKRILMPDEWKGYPLRKDYDILQQDTDWVRENIGIESGQ
jgi:NADH-quinone oxidoreductase subunit C